MANSVIAFGTLDQGTMITMDLINGDIDATADRSNRSLATASSTDSNFKVPFLNTTVNTTGYHGLLQDSSSNFTYNPVTKTLGNLNILSTLSVSTVLFSLNSGATSSMPATMTANSLTSGNALTISSTSTGRTSSLLNIVSTGGSSSSSTPIGAKISVTNSHPGSNTALELTASGSANNTALNVTAGNTVLQAVTASTINIPAPSGYHAKIFYGQFPNPAGSLNPALGDSVGLNNFGAGNQGIIIQTGAGDTGGLKITDDGVFIFGASDTGLFSIIDEDSNISRFSIDSVGNTTVNGALTVSGTLAVSGTTGTTGQYLKSNGSSAPSWSDITGE
jgi:hypothetical protein